MEFIEQYHHFAGVAIARVFLGFLFLFQGFDAVVRIGLRKSIATYQEGFSTKGIPKFLTVLAAVFTSYTELFCGVLLVFGVLTIPALYLLGLNLLVAALGFGIGNPLWNTRNVFPRLVLLLFLLLVPPGWHAWSLDTLVCH